MRFRRSHPSGCECPPPEQHRGRVLAVTTCPVCIAWERVYRFSQLELDLEEGVVASTRGHEVDDTVQVTPVLLEDGLPF